MKFFECGVDEFNTMGFLPLKCTNLISLHQSAVANHISSKYGA